MIFLKRNKTGPVATTTAPHHTNARQTDSNYNKNTQKIQNKTKQQTTKRRKKKEGRKKKKKK
ncbi:hypothetical protein, partial [Escherichia coli]|uniref:hypothetical protein n=1 Tax=Escherichia coli TaxID=562 RepID=UPI001BAF1AF3